MQRYGEINDATVGHTDNTGSDKHNQQLSERRAQAVHDYLRQRGVIPQRLESLGKGEGAPRASNATSGAAPEPAVEIVVVPVVAQG